MKILAMMGSPRADGNCAAILQAVLEGAKAAGHEIKVYNVNEMNVKGCQNCLGCRKSNGDCVLEDDLKPYWTDLHKCDALIVAAPNYSSLVCGQMITYMNRHYCILDSEWKTRLAPGKKLIGIFSQGSPNPEDYLHTYNHYLGDFEARGMLRHSLLIHAGGIDAKDDAELMKRAYEAGYTL